MNSLEATHLIHEQQMADAYAATAADLQEWARPFVEDGTFDQIPDVVVERLYQDTLTNAVQNRLHSLQPGDTVLRNLEGIKGLFTEELIVESVSDATISARGGQVIGIAEYDKRFGFSNGGPDYGWITNPNFAVATTELLDDGVFELEKIFQKQNKSLEELQIDPAAVVKIGDRIDGGRGNSQEGVHKVIMRDGRSAVLKCNTGPYEKQKAEILIQRTLDEAGISPKIIGYVSPMEVRFLQNESFRNTHPNTTYAVIMEEIPDAWSINQGLPPAHAADWDVADILRQIEHIEDVVSRLRIICADTELVISRDGKVFLIDLAKSIFVNSRNEPTGFAAEQWLDSLIPLGDKAAQMIRQNNDFSEDKVRVTELLRKSDPSN